MMSRIFLKNLNFLLLCEVSYKRLRNLIFDYDNAISVVDNVPASLWWQRFISFAGHYHITASCLSNVELLISVFFTITRKSPFRDDL